jgi:hypothetical protein
MIKHNILFIGLDTHKIFTKVAYIEDQRGTKPIHLGKILSNKPHSKNSPDNLNLNPHKQRCILSTRQTLVVIGFIDC